MEYLEKVEYHRLRSAVKGYAKEGISLAKEISKNKGNERSLLRKIKNSLGSYTRECYIAYGLIRGVPYKSIEKSDVFVLKKSKAVFNLAESLPTKMFNPFSTSSTHSVCSRSVIQCFPKKNASFCTPPLSVITNSHDFNNIIISK